jgi:site-specific recombinase XerD
VFSLPAKLDGKATAGLSEERMQKASKFAQRIRRLLERCVEKGLIEREKAGEKIVAYSTRHTRITEMFVEGHDHAVVMHDAGHRHPQTTERYKHLAGSHVVGKIRQPSQRRSGPGSSGSAAAS